MNVSITLQINNLAIDDARFLNNFFKVKNSTNDMNEKNQERTPCYVAAKFYVNFNFSHHLPR